MLAALFALGVSAAAAAAACTFCSLNANQQAVSFDLSTLPTGTWASSEYSVTSPCGQSNSPACGAVNDSMTQSCKGLGSLANISMVLSSNPAGFKLTLHGGFDDPPMPQGRNAVYLFVCDPSAPASNPAQSGGSFAATSIKVG